MNDDHQHKCASVIDTMPSVRYCECGARMPMTEQDRIDYRDHTGREWKGR